MDPRQFSSFAHRAQTNRAFSIWTRFLSGGPRVWTSFLSFLSPPQLRDCPARFSSSMLAILSYATLTFVPMARLPTLAMGGSPRVLAMATADDSAAASSPAEGVDKEVRCQPLHLLTSTPRNSPPTPTLPPPAAAHGQHHPPG